MKLVHNILSTSGRPRVVQAQASYTEYYLFNSAANLKAYSNNGLDFAYYGYNASNTRAYKLGLSGSSQWVNGQQQSLHLGPQQAMFYPNAYINFNQNGEYTKHYYNSSERIASRLGDNQQTIEAEANDRLLSRIAQTDELFKAQISEMVAYEEPAVNVPVRSNGEGTRNLLFPTVGYDPIPAFTDLQPTGNTTDIYYYHTNHLGSTAFVTDQNQTVTQGFLYAPFGEITTEYNSTFGNDIIPKYSFNAKELDEETGMYYYEARYYKPPVFTSRDPMMNIKPWLSPYNYCSNNPVSRVDPTGMLDGEYYGWDGKYLGTDNIDDNKVYVADGTTEIKNEDGSTTTSFNNPIDLGITHEQFCIIANIVKKESSHANDEDLWIAHTANNAAKKSGKTLYNKLNSGYSTVKDKTQLSSSDKSANANSARKAVINVLTGGADPTGGATLWDGVDFLAWGLEGPNSKKHPKFLQYSSIGHL